MQELVRLKHIKRSLPSLVKKTTLNVYGSFIETTSSKILAVCSCVHGLSLLKGTSLIDIVVVDLIKVTGRFSIKYVFSSSVQHARIVVCLFGEEYYRIPTLTLPADGYSQNYSSAAWLEREAWDLFGVLFEGNTDLRRILTDYGFSGHPLRKDFPLTGHYELYYSDTAGRLVSGPVELTQELRKFWLSHPAHTII